MLGRLLITAATRSAASTLILPWREKWSVRRPQRLHRFGKLTCLDHAVRQPSGKSYPAIGQPIIGISIIQNLTASVLHRLVCANVKASIFATWTTIATI